MADRSFFWTRTSPYLLSVMRIIVAFLFIEHGLDKLFHLPEGPFQLISRAHLFTLVPGFAGILEVGGGALLILGLFTRPIAFLLSGEMAFAYFMAHYPVNHFFPYLNGGSDAVAFCFVFLYLSAAGPGPWSLDRAVRRV